MKSFVMSWFTKRGLVACANREDSDQTVHPHSLIRVVPVCVNNLRILGNPYERSYDLTHCVDVQADPSVKCLQMQYDTFSEASTHLSKARLSFIYTSKGDISVDHKVYVQFE